MHSTLLGCAAHYSGLWLSSQCENEPNDLLWSEDGWWLTQWYQVQIWFLLWNDAFSVVYCNSDVASSQLSPANFSWHGIPATFVIDNSLNLIQKKKTFANKYGFKHSLTTPGPMGKLQRGYWIQLRSYWNISRPISGSFELESFSCTLLWSQSSRIFNGLQNLYRCSSTLTEFVAWEGVWLYTVYKLCF